MQMHQEQPQLEEAQQVASATKLSSRLRFWLLWMGVTFGGGFLISASIVMIFFLAARENYAFFSTSFGPLALLIVPVCVGLLQGLVLKRYDRQPSLWGWSLASSASLLGVPLFIILIVIGTVFSNDHDFGEPGRPTFWLLLLFLLISSTVTGYVSARAQIRALRRLRPYALRWTVLTTLSWTIIVPLSLVFQTFLFPDSIGALVLIGIMFWAVLPGILATYLTNIFHSSGHGQSAQETAEARDSQSQFTISLATLKPRSLLQLWLLWLGTGIIGAGLPLALISGILLLTQAATAPGVLFSLTSTLIVPLCIGLCQGAVLRWRFAMRGLWSAWSRATGAGAAIIIISSIVGGFIQPFSSLLFNFSDNIHINIFIDNSLMRLISAALAGILVGYLQTRVLPILKTLRLRWMVFSALSWAIGWTLGNALFYDFMIYHDFTPLHEIVFVEFARAILAWSIVIALNGLALVYLFYQARKREYQGQDRDKATTYSSSSLATIMDIPKAEN